MSGFGNITFGNFGFASPWINPNAPNLTDFNAFVTQNMAIPEAALPVGSMWIAIAFARAQAITPCYPCVAAIEFVLATYNCGGHYLLRLAPDQPGQCYFAQQRAQMNLNEVEIGVIQSSSDESTSNSFAIGEGMQNMTIGDLNFYKTPYGRAFLEFCQDYGPGLWGLS